MIPKFNRRKALSAVAALGLMAGVGGSAIAQDLVQLRLSMAGSETDQRSVAMAEVFAPAVSEFADYEPSYNATLFAQGTELEAISRAISRCPSPRRRSWRSSSRNSRSSPTGYVHQDAAHQVRGLQRPADGPVQAEGRSTSWA
jgi:hypothetical protein